MTAPSIGQSSTTPSSTKGPDSDGFAGKRFVILGVANESSIAWGIAKALAESGAELCFTFPNEALEKRVRPLAADLGAKLVVKCDVQSDEEIASAFKQIGEGFAGRIDGVIHSVAFAEKEDLRNRFHQTSRKGFATAMDISAYSLVAVTAAALPFMTSGGTVLTLSYLGAERVVQNYNVMGPAKAALEACVRYLAVDLGEQNVRVNALSAGPIKTLAAYGIPHFKELLSSFAAKAPLKRNITQEDVARTALYLLGGGSSGVTGETVYVDCGFNILGF